MIKRLWLRKPVPTYAAAHYRLYHDRGAASGHPCAECDKPARDWSLTGEDSADLTAAGSGLRYSTDQARYRPLCRRCHMRIDLGSSIGSGAA
jgi:endogenous inhibitor of DNA gyrase (YacG/DUF329 family)